MLKPAGRCQPRAFNEAAKVGSVEESNLAPATLLSQGGTPVASIIQWMLLPSGRWTSDIGGSHQIFARWTFLHKQGSDSQGLCVSQPSREGRACGVINWTPVCTRAMVTRKGDLPGTGTLGLFIGPVCQSPAPSYTRPLALSDPGGARVESCRGPQLARTVVKLQ
jgi:hypothetical protein